MDRLTLKGLKFHGLHGYFPEEREEGNSFEVDLTFHMPLQLAGMTDDLNRTVDYAQARKIVESVMKGDSVKLIETLAFNIGTLLFQKISGIEKLEVTLRKLNPPMEGETEYAEVKMSWPR